MGSGVTSDAASSMIRAMLRGLPSLKGPYKAVDWESFPATPQEAFAQWLADAVAIRPLDAVAQSQAAAGEGEASSSSPSTAGSGNPEDQQLQPLPWEPHAMTVSTVDADGFPDARVLILKNVDGRGWHFAAKAQSPKGRQLAGNAACALTFYWSPLGRQVRVRGSAVRLPAEECAADFLARPPASRVSALASNQSEVLEGDDSTQGLGERTRAAQALLSADPGYVPPDWLVYAVDPTEVEFWQGASDRQHQRLRYVRVTEKGEDEELSGNSAKVRWKKERLWP